MNPNEANPAITKNLNEIFLGGPSGRFCLPQACRRCQNLVRISHQIPITITSLVASLNFVPTKKLRDVPTAL